MHEPPDDSGRLGKDFEGMDVARSVRTKMAVERQHPADIPPLSYGHQRGIRKIHGQVSIFHHQTMNLLEFVGQGCFHIEGAPEDQVPQRSAFGWTVKEVEYLGQDRPSRDQTAVKALDGRKAIPMCVVSLIEESDQWPRVTECRLGAWQPVSPSAVC